MNSLMLISLMILYLGGLFALAYYSERNKHRPFFSKPWIYVLSLGVYCSAWTYYGSVGIAAQSGPSFLTIYLGPVIAMPLWLSVMRKVVQISKQHKISGIADFISMRYGNSRRLGALVTLCCLTAGVPYIALQLKAISESFSLLSGEVSTTSVVGDSTFYIALIIAVFIAFFGTQQTDASEAKVGIMSTVAAESVLKLVFFLVVGCYVCFGLFDGTQDLYNKAAQALPDFAGLSGAEGVGGGLNWLLTIALSFSAFFLLPRQFQVSVVENQKPKHLRTAMWFLPLYLLLFNGFVIFIAWGGRLLLPESQNSDYYSLLLPLSEGQTFLASLVFFGGLSAVISMIVVSTLALSNMLSNNLVIPYGFLDLMKESDPQRNAKRVKNIRRFSMFLLIIGAYFFYTGFSTRLSLYSIGLVSFVLIAQLAPSFFLGLYWNRGSSQAGYYGIIAGLTFVFYSLILPIILGESELGYSFVEQGPLGIAALKPHEFLGLSSLGVETHALFWSLLLNTTFFVYLSLNRKGNYRERNYAELFINSENYSQVGGFVWKGEAYVSDIKDLLVRFLGDSQTDRALDLFYRKYKVSPSEERADARLIAFSEKLLTGSLGAASARILLSSVSKEAPISLVEVLEILEDNKETKATNRLLQAKSRELEQMAEQLQEINHELLDQDKLKDEFLDTVAHELKTPVTSIQAGIELLLDGGMPSDLQEKFMRNIEKDSDRLSRLIHNILDLEKLASGRAELVLESDNLGNTIGKVVQSMKHLADKQGVELKANPEKSSIVAVYDEDRIIQVMTNLISNSLKFIGEEHGKIEIEIEENAKEVLVIVSDNGRGVPAEDQDYIFEKFYQSKNQNTRKPIGSGFGLAICKKILEGHQGNIWLDRSHSPGARFLFSLPKEVQHGKE